MGSVGCGWPYESDEFRTKIMYRLYMYITYLGCLLGFSLACLLTPLHTCMVYDCLDL